MPLFLEAVEVPKVIHGQNWAKQVNLNYFSLTTVDHAYVVFTDEYNQARRQERARQETQPLDYLDTKQSFGESI